MRNGWGNSMKSFTIILTLYTSCLIGMDPSDDANNNNRTLASIITKDNYQVTIRSSLIPLMLLPKNSSNQISFPFSSKLFEKLKELLEKESELRMITKNDFELHQAFYALVRTRYLEEKSRTVKELIKAALFLRVADAVLEVLIRLYIVQSKNKVDPIKSKFSDVNIEPLFHKWHFLCKDSKYEHDDFTISWQEIEYFYRPYLEDKFYLRFPTRQTTDSHEIRLPNFHLDSTDEMEKKLNRKKILWLNVRNLSMEGNCLTEVSFLRKMINVEIIQLQNNRIKHLNVSDFGGLKELNLNGNQLQEIPLIGGCKALEKLYLAKNMISKIEDTKLATLTNLIEIDLSDNQIGEICAGVFTAPKLFLVNLTNNRLQKFMIENLSCHFELRGNEKYNPKLSAHE